jgi:predicted nucleotidyltransferase
MTATADTILAGDLTTEAHDLSRRFAVVLRKRFGTRLRRITLFGSAARGEWTPDSDVDILVLLDRVTSEDVDWVVRQAFHMGVVERSVLVQPVIMAEAEFDQLLRRERAFALDVEAEGISL